MRLAAIVLAMILPALPAAADGALRCAVQPDIDRTAATEACRAVARDLLGPGGHFSVRETDVANDAADDLIFTTGPGGIAAFTERVAVMVPQAAPIHNLSNLTGHMICLMIGGDAQPALEAMARHRNIDLARLAFREDVEMRDAYNVGRCDAVIDTEARLNAIRQDAGVNRLRSRILPETVGWVTVRARARAALTPRVARVLESRRDIVQQPD